MIRQISAIAMSIAAFGCDGAPPTAVPVDTQPAYEVTAKPECLEGVHLFGGSLTIDWNAPTPCDLTPPMTLNLVWNASNYDGWGGDASVQSADTRCAEQGGTMQWLSDGEYRGHCVNIDY